MIHRNDIRGKGIALILLLLSVFSASAQQVAAKIDTTRNKIGAPFQLTVTATADTTARVVFPHGRLFGPMEVIRNYKTDTVRKGGKYELIRKYGITQFDSGKFTLPRLKVLIGGKPFYTDSLRLEVSGVKVDTIKQKMYDIKPIIEAESDWGGLLKWIVALLVILGLGGIGFGVYYFLKRRQKNALEKIAYKSPIEKATAMLQQLERKSLWQRGEVKDYYSELTDIARIYIEEEIHIPAMESTTTEVIEGLRLAARKKNMKLSPEALEDLEGVLKQADLVKFAKSKPLDFEIEGDKKRIEKTIVQIHRSIPEEEPQAGDGELSELMRQKLLKKKKKKRILVAAASGVAALFILLVAVVAIKGTEFVKDKILGHPTRELWEGEWVTSDYGNPPVTIETPVVLRRMDKSQLPREGVATLREMQIFVYGSPIEDFYITVSTRKEKKPMDAELGKVMDNVLKVTETTGGAQNLLVKKETFSTKNGVEGMKAYGTFSHINPLTQKSAKLYYEYFVFNHDGGLQTVGIQYEEGDEYGKKILERVMGSVELKTQQP